MHAWQRRIPLLLFVLSTTIYLLTLQRAIYGDGIFLEPQLTAGELAYNHILYLPLVWTVWSGLGGVIDISAETAMKVVSALAGGAGVALTYLIGLRVLSSALHALAAALLLMGLFGYWFHATATEVHAVHSICALVLCLGLIRTLDAGNKISLATISLLFLGTVLTPASHTSGIAMLPPVAYVAWRARPAQGQVLIAAGAGLVLFATSYLWLIWSNPDLRTYTDNHTAKMLSILTSPATLLPKTTGAAREFLLYAVPASTLMPAGLRVLFRTAPGHGWLFLLWVASWFLMVLPVGDFAFGSYHVPTFGVQAILAVVAFNALSRSSPRALLALLLAALPALPLALGLDMSWALIVWFASAAVLFVLASRDHALPPRWLLVLPLTPIALSATFLLPMLRQDPIRDRIHAVEATVGANDLVFYLAPHGITYSHWRRFFPGADGPDRRALNPRLLDYPSLRPALPDELTSRVEEALAGKRPLWLVGDLSNPPGSPRFQEFRDLLQEKFAFRVPDGAPKNVFLLTPKR